MESVTDILANAERKMQASLEVLGSELGGIRTGRANPALVENIRVDYGGLPTPLKRIAGIFVSGSNALLIQPWDPNTLSIIEKAILKSELGLMPQNDGKVLRINIPPLSEERRNELIRLARKRLEEGKVALRNVRRDAGEELKELEKAKEISQDELKRALNQLQRLTDNFIAKAEALGAEKEAELKEV